MVRSTLITLIFAALLSSVAHAEFSNRSLSLGPHVTVVTGTNAVLWGLHLEYSNYLESGFELFTRVPLLIAEVAVGAETASGQGRVFATGASAGVRYLFVEGTVQPWVGLQLTGLVSITQPVSWFLGGGTTIGVDWVLSESWSIGARGIYDVFIQLNGPWRHQLGGTITASVLF